MARGLWCNEHGAACYGDQFFFVVGCQCCFQRVDQEKEARLVGKVQYVLPFMLSSLPLFIMGR
jgi:hypothetical protein